MDALRASGIRCIALALLLALPAASAHGATALPGDSLARATELGAGPVRAFDELAAGEPHYFRFEIRTDDDPRLRLFAPAGDAPAGSVLAALFGEGLPNDTPVPADFERPNGTGALIFSASEREDVVDARVPARFVQLLDRAPDLAPGRYVLVLRSDATARVAILVGDDSAWWLDAMLLPAYRANARDFAGTRPWATLAAGAIGAGGVAFAGWRAPRGTWPLLRATAWASSALFAASLGVLVLDAARAGVVPWLALAGSLAALALALWVAWPAGPPGAARRIALGAAGILALVLWAGFLWGPMLALAGALLPEPDKR